MRLVSCEVNNGSSSRLLPNKHRIMNNSGFLPVAWLRRALTRFHVVTSHNQLSQAAVSNRQPAAKSAERVEGIAAADMLTQDATGRPRASITGSSVVEDVLVVAQERLLREAARKR